jgi:hypothetical protein
MAASKPDKQGQEIIKQAEKDDLPPLGSLTERPEGETELTGSALTSELKKLQSQYRRAIQDLNRDEEKQKKDRATLDEERDAYKLSVATLKEREEALLLREGEMSRRELDAETGFAEREHHYWDALSARMDELRGSLRKSVLAIEEAEIVGVRERIAEFQQLREELETSFVERTASLLAREADLERREGEQVLARRRLAADLADHEWKAKELEHETAAVLDRERTELDFQRQTWLEQKEVLEAGADELRKRVARSEQLERQAQYVDPLRIERERDDLTTRLKDAHEELSRRPNKDEVADLRSQLRMLEQQAKELDEVREEKSRLALQLESTRSKLESLRIVDLKNGNLVAEKAALEADVQDLRQALGDLSDRRSDVRPFQQCSAIDSDTSIQATTQLWEADNNLEHLVAYLQNCIAARGLYYDTPTLRSFLAGMGMSQLHLIQGISGTGKSSLPLEVANAFGVECRTIEVQAAWRERQDLLGYFNPFEHRYEETDFLTALYLAGSPKHSGSPFFVMLDEMNLSHPEQYLADVLSAMERPSNNRYLRLMNQVSPLAPEQLRSGMELALPPNVWIIGTANHDETTVSFAPKTYDRSHVMELPTKHPEPIDGMPRSQQQPLSLAALKEMFRSAEAENRRGAASCASDFLDGLRPPLAAMGVGWGNRIEKQIRTYAPIVTGAGGTVKEAVDDFVALKVLNKLEGRYDFTPTQLEKLISEIERLWEDVPGASLPATRMIGLLDNEINRLR